MRTLTIEIMQRDGTKDNTYYFSNVPNPTPGPLDKVYAFLQLNLQYSILTSNVLSKLVLGMNEPLSDSNRLRSAQPIQISDDGVIVFQGVTLTARYILPPVDTNGVANMYLELILCPSIYQMVLLPVVFDADQLAQINKLLNINLTSTLVAKATQQAITSDVLDYVVSDSDYQNVFDGDIDAQDLGANLYVMTQVGETRDPMLRSAIDYYNCVFYQQEDGRIKIRQLDATKSAAFTIDLQNKFSPQASQTTNTNKGGNNQPKDVGVLNYVYVDNCYSTPAVISNYALVDGNLGVSGASECLLSYAPNPKFFPRLTELQKSGWFVGALGLTQINNNVISDPTTANALNNFFKSPDVYMIASQASGVKEQFIASYQALLTAKETAMVIAGFETLSVTVSLDHPNIPTNFNNFIGDIMTIQNCPLKSGVVATASRTYSPSGSYLSFSVCPMGSFTGFWKNSK